MSAAVRPKKHQAQAETLPLDERIRRRAYELYLHRGGTDGSELEDWLQAEQEMLAEQDQKLEEHE
jgi:hypothetical protein